MDEELVYKQNMSRNEAMKILKAITIPLAVFALGLFTINLFGAFGRKLVCPLSGFMWIIGVAVAFLMPSQRNDTLNHLFPYDTDYKTILDYSPDGLMITSGPGNPDRVHETISTVQKLSERLPIFGICMGQQLVAKSFGARSYKMKFGHRGANQPVKDLHTGKVYITSQNHGFTIDKESINETDLALTQVNLNDGTPEGFSHKELPVHCIQYHPEAGPGPNDTRYVFDKFSQMMDEY